MVTKDKDNRRIESKIVKEQGYEYFGTYEKKRNSQFQITYPVEFREISELRQGRRSTSTCSFRKKQDPSGNITIRDSLYGLPKEEYQFYQKLHIADDGRMRVKFPESVEYNFAGSVSVQGHKDHILIVPIVDKEEGDNK